MKNEKTSSASELLDEKSSQLVSYYGYDQRGIEVFKKFLQIDALKNVQMCRACLDNRYGLICTAGIFLGQYGQRCFVSLTLAKPLMIVADFSLLSCSNKVQKAALEFAKGGLKKQVLINNIAHAESDQEEFEKHLRLADKFFENMHSFLLRKVKENHGGSLQITEQELFFAVPESLRTLPKDGYSWLRNRPENFFTHNH